MSYHDNIMDSLIMVDRYETGRSVQYTFHDQESDSIWAVIWYEETGKYFGEMDIWSRPDTLGNLDNGWTNEYIYCTCWSVDTIPNCWWKSFQLSIFNIRFWMKTNILRWTVQIHETTSKFLNGNHQDKADAYNAIVRLKKRTTSIINECAVGRC